MNPKKRKLEDEIKGPKEKKGSSVERCIAQAKGKNHSFMYKYGCLAGDMYSSDKDCIAFWDHYDDAEEEDREAYELFTDDQERFLYLDIEGLF